MLYTSLACQSLRALLASPNIQSVALLSKPPVKLPEPCTPRVDVMFTELDISVLPSPWEQVGAEVSQNFSRFEGDPKMDPYPYKLPKSVQNKLAKRYKDIFQLF